MREIGTGLFLKLAIRNVMRNTRRTLLTLAAIAFGATSIVLVGGFVNDIYVGVREQTIQSQTGHIQLHRRGFSEKGAAAPFDYMIANYEEIRALLARIEHVSEITPRLGFAGLISTGETTASFVGTGIHPGSESPLSSFVQIVDGQPLAPGDARGVTLGLGLARSLGLKPGNDVTLLTTTKAGGINALATKVRGVWESGEKAYDDRFLRAPISEVQRLLESEGEVQSIVLLLDRTESTPYVRDRIATLLLERGLDLEMETWEDLAVRYHQVRQLFGRIFNTLIVIVSLIVVLGVANTMTMAILERTREIGTVMALGTRRRDVVRMFLIEGLTLGAIGGAAGVLLGSGLAEVVSYVGIPMPPPPGSTRGFVAHIAIVPGVLARAFWLSLLAAVLSSLYPAWRASRLSIVDALRHV